jgi:predicted DNA-binding protein
MANENTRIQVRLDAETNEIINLLATKSNRSISATAADLIKEALELQEDYLLSKHGDERLANAKKFYSHEDAWKE